ncbi:acyl-CoA dehydrogenase [Amycolatopsis nigrescens]|uniref:acyl-CoA dehydrogenase n=1 Tax=Amycolatopsis nigrescens TaxID=381445 RepID=UPI000376D26D|nr:acyl-CoA dehydrogenase [Amycolatopsis nigrescens]
MPIAITEEQRALTQSIRAWADRHRPVDAVRELEHGGEHGRHLRGLAAIGLFAVAVPEELGGAGASVVDAAAGLEEAAAALVPGPVLGGVLAGLVLGRLPDSPVAKELVPDLIEGTAALAVAPGSLAGTVDRTGCLRVRGRVGPVPDADASAHLLLAAESDGEQYWFVLPPGTPGVRVVEARTFDFSRRAAHIELEDVAVPEEALLPGLTAELVENLTATLAAAEAAGIAGWCLRTATEYAGVREQFGRPIGSFQAIKHLCAEMLCRAELAAALAWDAARAADGGLDDTSETPDTSQHALAAATAAGAALEAAVRNAKDCVQVLGGIGFTWEHDAHLYLRRAVSLRQLLGGSAYWRRRAAGLALAGVRRKLDVPLEDGDPAVRATVAEIAALAPERQRARLAETGYLAPHWPRPYGLDATAAEQLLIDAELARAGVRRPDLVIGGWAAPTILEHGSPAQRERFVGPTLRGELTWCQLFSEPGAGSDLASLRTRAQRVEGGWRLTGQKVWTSLAREADWGICLARTDPDAPKHRGIGYFLVDMRSAGIEARPLREITGDEMFNEVFLDEVFVPDDCLVGEPTGGWRLARTTLANERVAMSGGSSVGEGVETLLEAVSAAGAGEDPVVLDSVGELVAEGSAGTLLDLRSVLRRLDGQDPGPESSVRKLIGVRHRQAVAEAVLDLRGPDGAVVDERTAAEQHEFLLSRCLSIAGGTTQVLLNLAAERLLGLPR